MTITTISLFWPCPASQGSTVTNRAEEEGERVSTLPRCSCSERSQLRPRGSAPAVAQHRTDTGCTVPAETWAPPCRQPGGFLEFLLSLHHALLRDFPPYLCNFSTEVWKRYVSQTSLRQHGSPPQLCAESPQITLIHFRKVPFPYKQQL